MSNHNDSGSIHGAESESSWDNQQKTSEAAQHTSTTTYKAPYYRNQGPIPGSYLVMFHPGRTVATHFAFLGRKFDVTELNEGYFADLDDGLLNAVRRDPAVRRVEDNVDGEADVLEDQSPPEAIQHAYQAPYEPAEQYPLTGSYIVGFHPGHRVAKHFAFLGREFDLTKLNEGYFAEMDDGLFNAVRCDPGVRLVAQNGSGERD